MPTPKPNAQMQAILDTHKAMGVLPLEKLTPEQARVMPLLDKAAQIVYGQHFLKRAMAPMPLPVGAIAHELIEVDGHQIPVRIYTPEGDAPESGWPILVYYHGGGWVIANLDTYDASCRGLCAGAKCVVVSVHYRQAPEHGWPAAYEDAFNAYKWVVAHAKKLGGSKLKIAVGGESAGGNLAAVVAQAARDNEQQCPVRQLLIYPVIDLINGPESISAKEHAHAAPLSTAMLHWFYDHYVPVKADRKHPYVSPIYGELKGLPAATVILAEIDPLRSEGEQYADYLRAAGVPVELQIYEGVTHEFFGLAGMVEEATDAMKLACDTLENSFARYTELGRAVA